MNFQYKTSVLLLTLLITSLSLNAQVNFHSQVGYSYMQHSNLNAISFTNGLQFKVGNKGHINIGFDLNYGEGNRNFNPKDMKDYSIEYNDYFPQFQPIVTPSNQFTHFQELEVKTSTTYQLSGTLGYGYVFNVPMIRQITIEGGMYLSYINKSYIANVIEDAALTWTFFSLEEDIEYDLVIPFYNRYIDVGPYINARIPIYKAKNMLVSASASYYNSGLQNGWFNFGLDFSI